MCHITTLIQRLLLLHFWCGVASFKIASLCHLTSTFVHGFAQQIHIFLHVECVDVHHRHFSNLYLNLEDWTLKFCLVLKNLDVRCTLLLKNVSLEMSSIFFLELKDSLSVFNYDVNVLLELKMLSFSIWNRHKRTSKYYIECN